MIVISLYFLTVLLVDTRTSTIEYSEAHRVGEERTGGGDHIVGLSVFPLAWILNQPSANQYGSLTTLVLIPELPSYDTLRSSIHHPRCRLNCHTS